MCGRYVSVSSPTILAERFHVEEVRAEAAEANYNVTPRAEVPVVAESQGTGSSTSCAGGWCRRGPRPSRSATG